MRKRWVTGCVVLFWVIFSLPNAFASAANQALLLDIQGGIGPASQDFVQRSLAQAAHQGAGLVILRLDTPGGLDKSMRGIVRDILASPVPVVTYVAPSGARAASAGTYILYASAVAAMAPGTNLGAATPVQIGMPSVSPTQPDDKGKKQSAPSTLDKKMKNDASAYIRSLAEVHGRNAAWGEKAVLESASLSAKAALKLGVIDLIAQDVPSLLNKLDGRVVLMQGAKQTLKTQGMQVTHLVPDWRAEFLSVITDPSVAYLLMIIGIWGLFFEFANPGFVVPGVIGGISFLVALYAFQLLPINYAGLGLILLGIAFMVGEAFIPSFGVMGIGGVIAFAAGSILLMDSHAPGFAIALPLILGVSVVSGLFFLLVINLALKAKFRPVVSGREELIGSVGEVLHDEQGLTRIRLRGELWQIQSDHPLAVGQKVKVIALDGLVLGVQPIDEA